MRRAIFSTVISLITCFVFQGTAFSAPAAVSGSADVRNSGEIVGNVNFCGPQGTSGSVVDLVGRSFSAVLGAGGDFNLQYVPEGAYMLRVSIPNQPAHTLPEPVLVAKGQITDVGVISRCEDNDGDGFTPDPNDPVNGNDCNDNNASINPGATEVCDGVDNDCDGNVDAFGCNCTDADNDGFFAQEGCDTAVDCDDANNTINPNAAEICDGVDNNCVGGIDEGFDLLTDLNNCGACASACSGVCEGGTCFSDCGNGIVEGNEECDDGNNTDGDGCRADCTLPASCSDGTPDGGSVACGSSMGACQEGFRTCTAGVFGSCVGEIVPSPEICDGVDNDCDGTTDEDFLDLDQPCDHGVGACARPGRIVCSANGSTTECGGILGTPTPEVCNSIDDDCNGVVDDGGVCSSTCGNGIVEAGEACDGGACCTDCALSSTDILCRSESGVCDEPDFCDGATPDCPADASAPAGTSCGSGLECNGTGSCICSPSTEVCDGIDNNCDGVVDGGALCGAFACGGPSGCFESCGAAGAGLDFFCASGFHCANNDQDVLLCVPNP